MAFHVVNGYLPGIARSSTRFLVAGYQPSQLPSQFLDLPQQQDHGYCALSIMARRKYALCILERSSRRERGKKRSQVGKVHKDMSAQAEKENFDWVS